MSDKSAKTMAASRIDTLRNKLTTDDDFSGAEWEAHRDLLAAAHNSTNGSAGNVEDLSVTVSLLAAAFVQSEIRAPERMRKTFADMHGDICPVVPLITKDDDGRAVMPWNKSVSMFSLSKDGIKANGPIAALVGVVATVAVAVIVGILLLSNKTAKAAATDAAVEVVQEMAKQGFVSKGE